MPGRLAAIRPWGLVDFAVVAPDQIVAERRGRRARQSAGFSRWTGPARRPPIGSAGVGPAGQRGRFETVSTERRDRDSVGA
jgi:hypothetical protein